MILNRYNISPAVSLAINSRVRSEWESLAKERDPQLYFEGLLNLGKNLETRDQLAEATAVYETILRECEMPNSEGGISKLRTPHSELHTLAQQAQERLDAIHGVGSSALRLEFNFRRIGHEAASPTGLFAMGAAGAAFRLTKLATLSRLATTPIGFLGRQAIAHSAAFFAETATFTLAGKSAAQLTGIKQDWRPKALAHEWAGGATMLLGLKAMGGLAGMAGRHVALGEGAVERFSRAALPQIGMFSGIMLGNKFSELGHFREQHDNATTLVDSLLTLLQFNVSGQLLQGALGEKYQRFEQRVELQSEALAARYGDTWIRGYGENLRLSVSPSLRLIPQGAMEGGGDSLQHIKEISERPLSMQMMGDGGKNQAGQGPDWNSFLKDVSERGKEHEVNALKNLLLKTLNEDPRRGKLPSVTEKLQSSDSVLWRNAFRILGGLVERIPSLGECLQDAETLHAFASEWALRPHFVSAEQVAYRIAPGTPKAHNILKTIYALRRVLAEDPTRRGWEHCTMSRRGTGEISRSKTVSDSDGAMTIFANWKQMGLKIRFDIHGYFVAPIELRRPYSEAEWESLELEGTVPEAKPVDLNPPKASTPRGKPTSPKPDPKVSSTKGPVAASPAQPSVDVSQYQRQPNENSSLWAIRLLEMSQKGGDQVASEITQFLEKCIRDPKTEKDIRELVTRFVSFTSLKEERMNILARHYTAPGLSEPMLIFGLPKIFPQERWSQLFAEALIAEFRRAPQTAGLVVEIGSESGYRSILLGKLGLARKVIGIENNANAQVLGRLNARLNAVSDVEFRQGELRNLSPGVKADLIIGSFPLIPKWVGSPSQGNPIDLYGLDLMVQALEQSQLHFAEKGRVLFHLDGRAGRKVLEDLMIQHGFRPEIRSTYLVQLDSHTDFSALANHESRHRLGFEFFHKSDLDTPILAREAIGKTDVYYRLYLMEGRI